MKNYKDKEDITLSELYESVSTDIITEGMFDRMGARVSGLGSGIKQFGSNVKNVFKDTKGQISPKTAAKAAKVRSIVKSFQNDLNSLLGDGWNSSPVLKTLKKELDTLQNANNEYFSSIETNQQATPAAPASTPAATPTTQQATPSTSETAPVTTPVATPTSQANTNTNTQSTETSPVTNKNPTDSNKQEKVTNPSTKKKIKLQI